MKSVAIIGGSGMLGSDLVRYLNASFRVTSVDKKNYKMHVGTSFDVVIDADGNSKRYWANENPREDFAASTVSVYQSIFDFPCDMYVYISSPDVYENHTGPRFTKENEDINPQNLSFYGFHKYISELIVKKHKEKYLILRCAMILGTKLKKGPFYDIIHGSPLAIALESRIQLITSRAVARVIEILLKEAVANEALNVGGAGTFDFKKNRSYFNREIKVSSGAETQVYEMNIEKIKRLFPKLKTSEEYSQEFLKDQ